MRFIMVLTCILILSSVVTAVDVIRFSGRIDGDTCDGDINDDGKVDVFDLSILGNRYGKGNCKEPKWCRGADINKDGVVNIIDLSILANMYGSVC